MDQKLFEQRLNELTQWIRINDNVQHFIWRNRLSKEDIIKLLSSPDFDTSDCHTIKVLSVNRAEDCLDCGEHCPDGRVLEHRKLKYGPTKNQWKTRCQTCKRTKDHTTGVFDHHQAIAKVSATEQRRREYEQYCQEVAKKFGIDHKD
jgi:hypothetical protein